MKKAFLITWVTHNSRISWRMIEYKIKKDDGFWMDGISEKIVTQALLEVVKKDGLKVLAYNICGDHVHLIMICEEKEVSKIVRKLKSQSARIHNSKRGISESLEQFNSKGASNKEVNSKGASALVTEKTENQQGGLPPCNNYKRGNTQNSLWAQKFHYKELPDGNALSNAVEYVRYNRIKHNLPPHYAIHPLIQKMVCSYDESYFV